MSLICLGKHGEGSSHTWKFQEKIWEKSIRFWRIILLIRCSHVYALQSTGDVLKHEVVYRRFFQFWLIFPNRNYQSRSIEYNFNWCWHHTLPLKKKWISLSSKICSNNQEQVVNKACNDLNRPKTTWNHLQPPTEYYFLSFRGVFVTILLTNVNTHG